MDLHQYTVISIGLKCKFCRYKFNAGAESDTGSLFFGQWFVPSTQFVGWAFGVIKKKALFLYLNSIMTPPLQNDGIYDYILYPKSKLFF
jgi:hypothetical protein